MFLQNYDSQLNEVKISESYILKIKQINFLLKFLLINAKFIYFKNP